MEYKFYRVESSEFISEVEKVDSANKSAIKQLNLFKKEVGAESVAKFNRGGIAYFEFNKTPNMGLWKKVDNGFMPRRGSKEGKALSERLRSLPSIVNIQDCLKVLGLHNMMVLGEHTKRGMRMYSANFCGKPDKGIYFIKVPQEIGNEYAPTSSDLVECKEWEMLKFMEED